MSSNKLKNLPPHVLRELKRHVSPKSLPKGAAAAQTGTAGRQKMSNGMKAALGGTILLTATAASFPLLATWWIGNLAQKEDPLTAPQVRRGAFLNSGTRDIGRDPEWDFEKGLHKTKSGYAAIAEEERSRPLPGEFLALGSKEMKKHEQDLQDFALGKKRPEPRQ
mmetsp:Transcript_793/g.1614  ORF Transcript_793/g.1614 Transcript_793/m.1614 type:complete len:165 (-) Transcript_793:1583-2077(-)|eukprot:scaffold98_cov172-Amphora_coffeaeformis.AAC.13